MNNSAAILDKTNALSRPHKLSRDTVFLIGDLLPLLDFAGVLLAAYLGTLVYANWVSPGALPAGLVADGGRAALAAAVLAPFLLCDRAFISFASNGHTAALIRCYAVRFLMFAGVVAAIGLASHSLASLPRTWVALWFAGILGVTALIRGLLVGILRGLERSGILVERIAVVGAGPVADRLVRHLRQSCGGRVEILGVFDDSPGSSSVLKPAGSIEDLIELGKSSSMDWILLTLPAAEQTRMQGIVHRLKSLAVPIGLCPQNIGVKDHPRTGWEALRAAAETVLPHWMLTLLGGLLVLPRAVSKSPATAMRAHGWRRPPALSLTLDDYDLDRFTGVAARFGRERFGYVVTPNADHLIRLHRDSTFRALYADAAYVLLDSRFISHVLRFTRKLQLPVCTGSDLTAKLFSTVIRPEDSLVLIGGTAEEAACLAQRHGLKQLAHFNPPMGFIHDPDAVETCLRFVEAHSPFRFCLLAVGAPQQEILAYRLKARGIARGMALCIGSSINFLTGKQQRAPQWMQRSGMEWLFRLLQAPGRMAERYLMRGPQLFGLLRRTEIVLRAASESRQIPRPSIAPFTVPSILMPRRPDKARSGQRIVIPRAARAARGAGAVAVPRRPPSVSEHAPRP